MAGDDDDDLVLTKPPAGWQPHPMELPPAGDFSPLGPVPPPVPKPKSPKNDPRFDLPPKPKLTRLDVPKYEIPKFPDPGSAGTGFGPSTDIQHRDQILTLRDQITMLAQNNIAWPVDSDLGSMQTYVLDERLRQSGHSPVRFSQLNMTVPQVGRQDNAGFSYNEFESSLQSSLVVETEFGVGVPPVFSMNVSYSDKSANMTHEGKIIKIFKASQMIEKARVTFIQDLLSLDEWFVRQVMFATSKSTMEEKALDLLRVLGLYGQFIALDRVIGGRISLKTTSKAEYRTTFDAVERELKAAAAARFNIDGVRVDAKGSAGAGFATTAASGLKGLETQLKMEMVGGNERYATSEPGTLGTKWVDSVGPYLNWRTFGFSPNTLLPILDLLEDQKDDCTRILRWYFLKNLQPAEGEVVGHGDGNKFGPDISKVSRIAKVEVNHDGNVDALKVTYEVFTGDKNDVRTKEVTETYGSSRSEGKNESFTLAPGDEIIRIVAWIAQSNKGELKRLRFETASGGIFPRPGGFYGKNSGDYLVTIEGLRVRGIYGFTGDYIHSIGFKHLQLANVKHREFLLAMEPYLFPKREYGRVP
jgi:Jacalin-like lectin domain